MSSVSQRSSLGILQQAARTLAVWSGLTADASLDVPDNEAMQRAKNLLCWPGELGKIGALRSIFDFVSLENCQDKVYYWESIAIESGEDDYPKIPYPQLTKPTDFSQLKAKIRTDLETFSESDWENASLLSLVVEKFGSYISWGDEKIAFVDLVRSTAAVSAALASDPNSNDLTLVGGDLSGIQDFIYTIPSGGALKSLRARSFFLELVTEEIVQQLLQALDLPRTNIIYAGGGNLYILAPSGEETQAKVNEVRSQFNVWFADKFQARLFLALDGKTLSLEDLTSDSFSANWSDLTGKQLAKQKSRKFSEQIVSLLDPYESDDPYQPYGSEEDEVEEGSEEYKTYRTLYQLGRQLFGVRVIMRSTEASTSGKKSILTFDLPDGKVSYYISKHWQTQIRGSDTVFLVNDWTVRHYKHHHSRYPTLMLLGKYGKRGAWEMGFMSSREMAAKAQGIDRLGYLRMDVDNLGKIFASGLQNEFKKENSQALPKIAGLSRSMSYFFKVYLNSLAKDRASNFLETSVTQEHEYLSDRDRDNLLFIYAGGDDLFVSGSWDDVVEFSFDVYQSFRNYTGYNQDITLSAGVSIASAKFPLYQCAYESGEAEKAAKNNKRDSLGLFGEVLKWSEWLGEHQEDAIVGVIPLVEQLQNQQLSVKVSRNFVRNLLLTAKLQERMIEERDRRLRDLEKSANSAKTDPTIERLEREKDDIRYHLHLPKIAYTIARLPQAIRQSDTFTPIRQSLLSYKNAPYFKAIATWIELLTRSSHNDNPS